MSFQEKSAAAMLSILVVVYGVYAVVILRWASNGPVEDIVWQPLMLLTIVPVVVLAIASHIPIAMLSPGDAGTEDERDREINLRGELIGGAVLGVGVVAGLGLTMAETEWFWIGQALLGALVFAEIATNGAKLVLYRRGV